MASEITPATLTLTLTTQINLDGEERGTTVVETIASIIGFTTRIERVPITEINLLSFQASNPGAGTYDKVKVRVVIISNRDDANHVVVVFTDDSGTEVAFKLDAGDFLIYNADNSGGVVNTMIASGTALTVTSTVTVGDLTTISAIADGAPVDVEMQVATVA